ncbi:MAG: quinolinate synthase NadA [Endomicrobium sp.]|jgi:quinolinate synthase|nr:quinolinate synthase NadA [Endomicrobium sp.]
MIDKKILKELKKLKKEKNAVILAHIYQLPEIQDIADFIGDSLDLSKKATQINADVIVFCGVHFMAETAAILNPNKKILIPDIHAGCPMAEMITLKKLKKIKQQNEKSLVVSYINTSASIKSESDICCTSANAIDIISNIIQFNKEIIFIPDRNLGNYVQKTCKKKMLIWNGFCPTHNNFILPDHVVLAKNKFPKAEILVHPECRYEVIALANHVMSTGGMCKYIKTCNKKEFIIGTETGILYKLRKDNPTKSFYPLSPLAICPNMKKITLSKVLDTLNNMKNIVKVPENIRRKAYLPIIKMLKPNWQQHLSK